MSFEQEIQKKEFARRLHILKGFTNLDEVATIQISTLVKSIGTENIYEHSGLERMTKDVLQKGVKEDIFKAKKFISELNPVNVLGDDGLPTTVYVEKGHMNFSSGKPRNSDLQEKKITDKNGHQTTRYVKNGEEKKEEKQAKPEETSDDKDITPNQENSTPADEKSPEQWASETASEDLQNYLDNNPNGDLAEDARWELDNRGELDLDRDDATRDEAKENGEEPYPDAQDDTAAIMQQFMSLDTDKQAEVMSASIEHNISIKAALAMSGGGNDAETHAKIDAAQAALNDLKSHTGHPDGQDDTNQFNIIENSDPEEVENLRNSYRNMDDNTLQKYVDFDDNDELSQALMEEELNNRDSPEDTGAGDNTGFEDEDDMSEEERENHMNNSNSDEDDNKHETRGDDAKSVEEDNKDFHENNEDDSDKPANRDLIESAQRFNVDPEIAEQILDTVSVNMLELGSEEFNSQQDEADAIDDLATKLISETDIPDEPHTFNSLVALINAQNF